MDDPYTTLGVARDASPERIQRAYRKLAKAHHPDLNPGDKQAEERFKTVSAANELLSDPDKRDRFDRGEIDAGGQERPAQPSCRDYADGPAGRRYGPAGQEPGHGGFDDLFGSMFILPAARGTPQIEVTFDIDANGIVSVQAKDKATGKEQQIRIQSSGGLSDSDIQKMVREAEANAGADKKRRAFIEAKNHADGLVHQVRKDLAEHGGTMPAADRAAAEAAILTVMTAMEGTDADQLKRAADALAQVATRIGEAAAHGPASGGAPGGKPDEGVVDAEFEEAGDRKRSA